MFGSSSSGAALSARASVCGGSASVRAAAAASATAARRAASQRAGAALRVTAGGDKKSKSGDNKPKKKRNQLPEPPAALPAFAPPPTPSAPLPPAPFSPLPPRSLLPKFDPSAFPGLVASAPAPAKPETGHHRFLAPQPDLRTLLGTNGAGWEPTAVDSLPPRQHHRRARSAQGGEVAICTGKSCRKDGARVRAAACGARRGAVLRFCGRSLFSGLTRCFVVPQGRRSFWPLSALLPLRGSLSRSANAEARARARRLPSFKTRRARRTS
jgi:hypothetical protein